MIMSLRQNSLLKILLAVFIVDFSPLPCVVDTIMSKFSQAKVRLHLKRNVWFACTRSSLQTEFIITDKEGFCRFLLKWALVQLAWRRLLNFFWTISVLITVSQAGVHTHGLSVILACSTSYTFFFSITPLEILFLFQFSFTRYFPHLNFAEEVVSVCCLVFLADGRASTLCSFLR